MKSPNDPLNKSDKLGIVLLIAFVVLLFLAGAVEAKAAFKPAPTRIVKQAAWGQPMPPKFRPLAKKAWIICRVWKGNQNRCRRILNVVQCESGFSTTAKNGQYLGLFQMGNSERARYGHGAGVWVQALAAHSYWLESHWRPWECKPDVH